MKLLINFNSQSINYEKRNEVYNKLPKDLINWMAKYL